MSDLRANTVRSLLAEFIVTRALGADPRPRVEWDSFDVVTPEKIRVEVKSGAYLQAWEQPRLSAIRFGGLKARTWSPAEGYSSTRSYNADAYVFAVLTATDHAAYDALDESQWLFWVLARDVLAGTGQLSIGLSTVDALAGPPVGYSGLAERVRTVVAGGAGLGAVISGGSSSQEARSE